MASTWFSELKLVLHEASESWGIEMQSQWRGGEEVGEEGEESGGQSVSKSEMYYSVS